jgi:UDP-N-acetylmuramyl pentapeptide phosphotransferase/UDP-N-acetylglucosamine-1-phosphate transferase
MPDIYPYIGFLLFFFTLELLYFRIAVSYKIIDKPNERSSHDRITVRGGGIIFPLALICWFFLSGFQYPFFITGLILISLVSFVDDILDLHGKTRFFIQVLAVGLMFWQLPLGLPWYGYFFASLIIIGTINAYNFMDGINGITGIYSIITLLSLFYINTRINFTDNSFILLLLLSLAVFGFFNFRKKAKCFAGDIGSVSIAFSICFLILLLILKTGNFLYILLLLVYGLDAVSTIVFRLIRRENIFEAHRTHFYQYLSNERQWPHLLVSAVYGIIQLAINTLLISLLISKASPGTLTSIYLTALIAFLAGLLMILLRFLIEGKNRLLMG